MLVSIFWAIVGVVATMAIYSNLVRDTTQERLALAAVAITAFAAAFRAWYGVHLATGDVMLAGSIAVYAVTVTYKESTRGTCDQHLPKDKRRDS